jgi:hypothetical protein
MIDLKHDELLSLAKAREWIGDRTGSLPSRMSIYTWIHKGIKGVKLEAAKIGGKIYTSVEALERFANRDNESPAPAVLPLSKRRQREIAEANRRAKELFG